MADQDRSLSKTKKFSLQGIKHKKTDHTKFLFLKVPFKYVVSNYVAILIKVFKGKIDC